MYDSSLEGAAHQQRLERLADAARARRAAALDHPKGRARHSLASSLRRFADKLDG